MKDKRTERGKATNIRVYADTKKEFEMCGCYGDTADTLLRKLISVYKKGEFKDLEL